MPGSRGATVAVRPVVDPKRWYHTESKEDDDEENECHNGGVGVANSMQQGRAVSRPTELVGRRSPAFTSLHAAPSKEQRHRGAIRVIHGPGCGDRHRGAITSPSHIADEHAASWAGICCLSRLRGSPLSCALRATKTLLMLHTGRLCRS